MHIDKRLLSLVLLTISVFTSNSAHSQSELDYALGMSIGIRDIEFDFKSTALDLTGLNEQSSADVRIDFEETLYTAGFWGTIFYDRLHITGLIEIPPEEEDTTVSAPEFALDGGGVVPGKKQAELDRFDASLTVGFEVRQGLSIFGGYKYTEFTLDGLDDATLLQSKDTTYEEQGLFLGANYAWHFGQKGSLSLSFAYAYLDADYSEDNAYQSNQFINLGELNYSSTSKGLSYGGAWSGPLADNWLYSVGLKFQSYEADDVSAVIDAVGFPDGVTRLENLETEHSDTVFSVGLQYIFH